MKKLTEIFTVATLLTISLLILVDNSTSLWSGPRTKHCNHMMPGHGVAPQNTESPFNITTKLISRQPSKPNKVLVNIHSTDGETRFLGFFLQVRAVFDYKDHENGQNSQDWELYGQWRCKAKNTKTLDCHDEINVIIFIFVRTIFLISQICHVF